jgi:hypothetical protein
MVQDNRVGQQQTGTRSIVPRLAGILSIIFAFTAPLAGIVMGAIGIFTNDKKMGKNTPAIVGLVMSVTTTIMIVVISVMLLATFAQNIDSLTETCQEQGPGRHRIGSFVSVTCGNDGRIIDVDF